MPIEQTQIEGHASCNAMLWRHRLILQSFDCKRPCSIGSTHSLGRLNSTVVGMSGIIKDRHESSTLLRSSSMSISCSGHAVLGNLLRLVSQYNSTTLVILYN